MDQHQHHHHHHHHALRSKRRDRIKQRENLDETAAKFKASLAVESAVIKSENWKAPCRWISQDLCKWLRQDGFSIVVSRQSLELLSFISVTENIVHWTSISSKSSSIHAYAYVTLSYTTSPSEGQASAMVKCCRPWQTDVIFVAMNDLDERVCVDDLFLNRNATAKSYPCAFDLTFLFSESSASWLHPWLPNSQVTFHNKFWKATHEESQE